MNKKNKPAEGVVHVKLNNPLGIRKNIFATAIDVANVLKMYDGLRISRARKLEVYDSLNETLNGMRDLFDSLESNYLPLLPIFERKFDKEQKEDKKIIVTKHTDNEIEKLKGELEEIERKLKGL